MNTDLIKRVPMWFLPAKHDSDTSTHRVVGMLSAAVKTVCLLLPVLLFGCAEFSTSFEEIEENRVRTIDFIYKNLADTTLCEAAPGDSMEITALFAGEKVRDIDMTVSFNVATSLYGQSSSSNEEPIDYRVMYSTLESGSADADTFIFRFAVPQSMLRASQFLPEENWVGELPKDFRSAINPGFAAKTKTEMVSLIETFAENHMRWDSAGAAAGLPVDSLYSLYKTAFVPFAESYLQIFSALFELKATVNGSYSVISQGTVRYQRKFGESFVTVNKNPRIQQMGIYRVYRNNLTWFDPEIHSQSYEKIVLFDRSAGVTETAYTLAVKPDESYFLFALADEPQTVVSMYGTPVEETYMFEWFYQQDPEKDETAGSKDRMSLINNADGPIAPLLVSESGVVSRCGVWVQVRDEAIGPRLYPTGSSVYSTQLFFSYSPEFTSK